MTRDTCHLLHEADIGSGEKNHGDHETEEEIRKVRNPQMDKPSAGAGKEKEAAHKEDAVQKADKN
jgi:hypothetical protein